MIVNLDLVLKIFVEFFDDFFHHNVDTYSWYQKNAKEMTIYKNNWCKSCKNVGKYFCKVNSSVL